MILLFGRFIQFVLTARPTGLPIVRLSLALGREAVRLFPLIAIPRTVLAAAASTLARTLTRARLRLTRISLFLHCGVALKRQHKSIDDLVDPVGLHHGAETFKRSRGLRCCRPRIEGHTCQGGQPTHSAAWLTRTLSSASSRLRRRPRKRPGRSSGFSPYVRQLMNDNIFQTVRGPPRFPITPVRRGGVRATTSQRDRSGSPVGDPCQRRRHVRRQAPDRHDH